MSNDSGSIGATSRPKSIFNILGGSPGGSPPEAEPTGEPGIYTNINKVVVLSNKVTGQQFVIDISEQFFNRMRKKIFAWADVTNCYKNDYGNTYALIQLSYKNNNNWKQKNITDYVQRVIKKIGRENVYDYSWVFEIKSEGRNLHYHVAFHIDPKIFIPYPDKSGMWGHGSTHIYRGQSSPYYMCKYMKKLKQKFGDEFPKGSRKYSVWLNKDFYSDEDSWDIRKPSYPKYVVDFAETHGCASGSIVRRPGGGWVVKPMIGGGLGEDEFTQYEIQSDYFVTIGDHIRLWFPELYEEITGSLDPQ